MCADPEPGEVFVLLDGECAMVDAYSGRPEASDPFEVHRGMSRVLLHHREGHVSQLLNVVRQLVHVSPEVGGCSVSHRSVHRPSRRSRRASSARWSSRPAATSASISRSHNSASNSANHARKASMSDGCSLRIASSISCIELMVSSYQESIQDTSGVRTLV